MAHVSTAAPGHEAGFVAYRAKRIDTVLGPITLRRGYYHCPACEHGLFPRDDELDITGVSLSPGLRAMTARAGTAAPFAQVRSLLADLAGITVTTKRVERCAEAAGAAATTAQAVDTEAILHGTRTLPPPAGPLPDMLYLAVDGTGLPMRASETTGRAGKHPDGRARTREAKLAALFTQTTTTDDGHPIRDPDSTSYTATLEPVEHFADLVQVEARRRGADHIRQLVVIGDGARWIWNLADQRFPQVTQIVDLFHAREHLHELADLLAFILTDPAAWLAQRLTELDNGNIEVGGCPKPSPPPPASTTCPAPKPTSSTRQWPTSKPTPTACATPTTANTACSSAPASSKPAAKPSSAPD